MSEIQTISQGNYLLSNLDAQKLYAQSPLTTGVSGSSAYIGIEPSARYNETVLWSSNANAKTTAFTVSQPLTAFEKIRYEVTGYTHVYAECTQNSPTANNEEIGICFTYYCKASDANPLQIVGGSYSSNNGLDYGLTRSKFLYMTNDSNAWNNNQTDGPHLQKIIGINRKEV